MRVVTFERVFVLVLSLLIVGWSAVFLESGVLAWSIGILFFSYDTWLLSRMILLSRAALREPERPAVRQPVTMTVLIPARNEASVLPACLDAVLAEKDQPEQIWVIDDGSTDGTAALLAERYGIVLDGQRGRSTRHSHLWLWSKESTGKAESFNRILADCTGDVVMTIDADTVIEPGAIAAVRESFWRDPKLAAGCGVLIPRCGQGRFAAYFEFFQRFEYLRAFLWRLAWSRLNALVLVSGAFAAYRRPVLEKIGGFAATSWVEDYELLYRLHRMSGDENLDWQVRVIVGARAVTDAPGSVRQFLRQRSRWFGGFLGTLFGNRDMVGQPAYGKMGRILLPVKTIDTVLPFFAASTQISLLYLLAKGNFLSGTVLAIIAAKLLFDLTLHVYAMRLYARWLGVPLTMPWLFRSLAASVLEPFFFQPLRYTGAIAGWVAFLRNRLTWHAQRLPAASPAMEEGS